MRIDAIVLLIVLLSCIALSLNVYRKAVETHARVDYNLLAWLLAEKAANAVTAGEKINTEGCTVEITLKPLKGESRTLLYGNFRQLSGYLLGEAYTFRILANGTLLKVHVKVYSPNAKILQLNP